MADQRSHISLFFPFHQDGHEVVDLIHVHVPHVVTANQHLGAKCKEQSKELSRYKICTAFG